MPSRRIDAWLRLKDELEPLERWPAQDRPALVCFCGAETRGMMCMNPICPEYRRPVPGEGGDVT